MLPTPTPESEYHEYSKPILYVRIQWGTGGPDPLPLKNHKNIGFLSNTGPDPLKNHKATIQCRAIIGTPAKRHLNGVSLVNRRWPAYSDILILPPLIKLKKKIKKTLNIVSPSDKTFWIRSCPSLL